MQGMSEMRVQSLGWEDLGILPWRIPWTEEPGGLHSPWDCKELDITEATEHRVINKICNNG